VFHQLGGAQGDLFLELLPVSPEVLVPKLDLTQHLVEAVDQVADLVSALFGEADRVVLLPRYHPHRPRKVQDRLGDQPLEPGEDEVHDGKGAEHERPGDDQDPGQPCPELLHVRLDDHRGHFLAVQENRQDYFQV
jgi:hypothetical protein